MITPLLLCVCLGFAGADRTVTFKVIVVDFFLQSHRYALMLSEFFLRNSHLVPEQFQFFNTRKLTYKICLDLSVLHLFLSGALWEEVQCTARVVDGYSAILGAHRHEAASSSWLTSLFLMVDLPLPHVVVELLLLWSRKELHPAHGNCTSVLMMKTFLCKDLGNCSCSSQPVHEKSIQSSPK
jgi:hypothetical protein